MHKQLNMWAKIKSLLFKTLKYTTYCLGPIRKLYASGTDCKSSFPFFFGQKAKRLGSPICSCCH